MKKLGLITLLITILFCFNGIAKAQSIEDLVEMCRVVAGEASYVRDFKAQLDEGNPAPIKNQPFILLRNTEYVFSICSSRELEGELIIELFDTSRLVTTNYSISTSKYYDRITFKCSTSGPYRLKMYFKDGKAGSAVVMLSMLKRV
ncbi:MAG: hypothetical protein JXA53_07085 [Bacteroidales bacterium]|nr:hypothetical protein [Bacteroidales bacterium]